MESLVRQMIADSMELAIPPLTRRQGAVAEMKGAASVLVGMRRCPACAPPRVGG